MDTSFENLFKLSARNSGLDNLLRHVVESLEKPEGFVSELEGWSEQNPDSVCVRFRYRAERFGKTFAQVVRIHRDDVVEEGGMGIHLSRAARWLLREWYAGRIQEIPSELHRAPTINYHAASGVN